MGVARPNTVLMTHSGTPWVTITARDGARLGAPDVSYVEYFAGALIAQSATRLAVRARDGMLPAIQAWPAALRDAVVVVDKHDEAHEKARALLEPLLSPLGVTIHGRGSAFQASTGSDDAQIVALVSAFEMLETLIVGIDNEVNVSLNLQRCLALIATLREGATRDARANLSFVENLLKAYELVGVPGLEVRAAVNDRVRAFSQLVTDSAYHSLSQDARRLALPTKATIAVRDLRRRIAEFISRPAIGAAYEVCEQAVSVATSNPLPSLSSERAASIIHPDAGYLPPLFDVSRLRAMVAEDLAGASVPPRLDPVTLRDIEALHGGVDTMERLPQDELFSPAD